MTAAVSTTIPASISADLDELSLDITVVETGDAVDALLCSTDNGCDTKKTGDC